MGRLLNTVVGDEAEEQRLGGRRAEWDAGPRRASLWFGLWLLVMSKGN